MSRFVRPSKYRHVYGQQAKKELAYDNLRISASAWDTNLAAVNPKYIAVNWQASGGGAFAVLPIDRTGKIPDIYPLVRGHTAPVLDTAWNPFDDQIIASAGEDSRVQITKIDDALLNAAWNEGEEVQDLKPLPTNFSHGGRKVGHVLWHPTASGVLASASADIKIWDVDAGSARIELQAHPDMVQSLAFNSTGSCLATTCKDKKLRIYDLRAGAAPISVAESHSGVKGSRVCWLGQHDRIVTTGFSRMSDRQVFLWDAGHLDKPLKQVTVDTSSGTLMPFFSDNNILFLAGKGDGNIRYYEYENDDLLYLTEFKSNDPQRGMTFLPRRGLNVSECEIARAYKVTNNAVDPIAFIVPRKSDAFQADIFPPAPSAKPAQSASDFFGGQTKGPILVDLESGSTSAGPTSTYTPAPTKSSSVPAPSPAPASPSQPAKAKSMASPSTPAPLQTTPSASTPASRQSQSDSPVDYKSPATPASSAALPTPGSIPSSASQANGSNGGSGADEALRAENERLKEELSERDLLIRDLELKVERLQTNQKALFSKMQEYSKDW